jgi:hypothetical protein
MMAVWFTKTTPCAGYFVHPRGATSSRSGSEAIVVRGTAGMGWTIEVLPEEVREAMRPAVQSRGG